MTTLHTSTLAMNTALTSGMHAAVLPKLRPEIWYPMLGFGMLSFFCFTIFAITVWAKINGWLAFGLGLAGAAFALTSGMYASRGTVVAHLLATVAGWSPWVALALALAALASVCYLAVASIPNSFAPAVSLTAGLAFAAFLLPSLSLAAMPTQGSVWVHARQAIDDTGSSLVQGTDGWFWAPSAKATRTATKTAKSSTTAAGAKR